MKNRIAIGILFTLSIAGFAKAVEPAATDELKIAGAYNIVGGEKSGEPLPPERVEGHRIVITGDRIIATDAKDQETYVATYVLDTSVTPHTILMTSVKPQAGETAMGLVKKENDRLLLIYSLPGGDRPMDFKTQDKQHLFILEKSE
jgi:uncharacterized protein (TIGR03067 family)